MSSPLEIQLHLSYVDTLVRADLDTAHAADAFASIDGIGLAVGSHFIDLDRTDVYTFSAARAAVQIDVNQIHAHLRTYF
jgi:hypothetical protein